MKRLFAEMAVLVTAAVFCGVAGNAWRGESLRLPWFEPAPSGLRPGSPEAGTGPAGLTLSVDPPHDGSQLYRVISGDLAYRLHRSGVMFVDARRTEAYERGHISGARSVPAWEGDVEKRIAALKAEGLTVDREVVLYCSGPDCQDSERLAGRLTLTGFFNLHLYKDGFPDWKSRGWPVTEGRAP